MKSWITATLLLYIILGGRTERAGGSRYEFKGIQMTVHAPVAMTKEAFLAWVEQREERYEFAGGRAVMMVQVTRNHGRITRNLVIALSARLVAEQHDIFSESFAVAIGDNLRIPDIVVEPTNANGRGLETRVPILIIEVLSPGTFKVDFGDKRDEYLSLPSLSAYAILSSDKSKIWLWQRVNEQFPPEPEVIEGAEKCLTLTVFGIEIPLSEIYRGVSQ
jgi:Uma2 family endonuclease